MPPPDPSTQTVRDPGEDVDFGRYLSLLVARRWLLLAGLVSGLAVGYVLAIGHTGTAFSATADVFVGQPTGPESVDPVASAPTTLALLENFLTSADTVRRVADRVALTASRLAPAIHLEPLSGSTISTRPDSAAPAPLLAVTVSGLPSAKVAAAANELARVAVAQAASYTAAKVAAADEQLSFDKRDIARVDTRITLARRQQTAIIGDRSLGAVDRLLLLANVDSSLARSEQRLGLLEQDKTVTQQELSLARDVELPRVLTPAVPTRLAGWDRRTSTSIGGFGGLLLAVAIALSGMRLPNPRRSPA